MIGWVDVDPCSNERSHIRSEFQCIRELGDDGLAGMSGQFKCSNVLHYDIDYRFFVNPPYGTGHVIRWVEHYRDSRAIFLLRWAPDTAWFRALMSSVGYVWFPDVRINFEPPPGVKSSSNPFPHALYFTKHMTRDERFMFTQFTGGQWMTVGV